MSKSFKKSSYKEMKEILKKFNKSERLVEQLFYTTKERKIISSKLFDFNENQIELSLSKEDEKIKYLNSNDKFYEAIAAIVINDESYYMLECPKKDNFHVKEASVVFFNIEIIQESNKELFIQCYFVKKQDKSKPSFMVSRAEDKTTCILMS